MEPKAKQDHHQQNTSESQPEAPASKQVRESKPGGGGQEKEHPPHPRLGRGENTSSGLQVLFNFLVVVFTGALVYLSYGQLEVTRRSVEVAQEATEATKRAADAAVLAAETARGQLEEMKSSSADTKAVADAAKAQAANTEKLAFATQQQIEITRDAVAAAKSSAHTADQMLILAHRPWVRAKHEIKAPLTFDPDTSSASLLVNEVLENIGQSVAIDIVSWTAIFPSDPSWGHQDALTRRNKHCDTLRDPKFPLRSSSIYGAVLRPNILFPKQEYPPVLRPLHAEGAEIKKAVSVAHPDLHGEIALIVVGCVSYRGSFEAPDILRHQTRYIYILGHPDIGRVLATVKPFGSTSGLGLVPIPEETTAD